MVDSKEMLLAVCYINFVLRGPVPKNLQNVAMGVMAPRLVLPWQASTWYALSLQLSYLPWPHI